MRAFPSPEDLQRKKKRILIVFSVLFLLINTVISIVFISWMIAGKKASRRHVSQAKVEVKTTEFSSDSGTEKDSSKPHLDEDSEEPASPEEPVSPPEKIRPKVRQKTTTVTLDTESLSTFENSFFEMFNTCPSQLRFLPLRFDVHGTPIDSEGFACQYKACPRCLLKVPDILLTAKTSYVSIVGAPSSGKSYFLTSMTYKMRSTFPNSFKYSFIDSDPQMNERLRQYESRQFESEDATAFTAIEKTQVTGSTYSSTMINGQMFQFPQPYIFTMRPLPENPQFETGNLTPNSICFYDNAGESYLSGQESETFPVTRHLQNTDAILFLFDPMQDAKFRHACRPK